MYTLMIVDDEPLTRQYMKINVPKIDSRWVVAAEAMEGTEALELLEKTSIDLVITDIKMPIMNGIELCEKLHDRFPNQKIIILSGYEEFEFAKKALQYGVQDYLLKPIVQSDLKHLLQHTANQIEKEICTQKTADAMLHLSDESKKQVIKNFLKAVITNAYVEVKALYPLLYKIKETLIESEACIVILCLDVHEILCRDISVDEIHLLQLLLNETASHIAANEPDIKIFFDGEENTVLLVNGEDENQLFSKSYCLFNEISKSFFEKTNISITGAVGEAESELLQLSSSYQKARTALNLRLVNTQTKFYLYTNNCAQDKKLCHIHHLLDAVKSAILDNNPVASNTALSNYIQSMEDFTLPSIFKFGIYLIHALKGLYPLHTEYENIAMNQLVTLSGLSKRNIGITDVLPVFIQIGNTFNAKYKSSHVTDSNYIISKAKEYIYAHYSEPLSLALIAEEISVSPSYLSNTFHKNVGQPYTKFITQIRMEEAAKLLRIHPSVRIYDIAQQVGYISVKHFSYIFKKYFHISPSEYREKYTERT